MIRFQSWLRRLLVSKAYLLSKIMLRFKKLLTDGIDVEVKQKDGSIKTEKAYIFDARDPLKIMSSWQSINIL